MKIIIWKKASQAQRKTALKRPTLKNNKTLAENIANIAQTVKQKGDAAVRAYSQKFDGVTLKDFRVSSPTASAALRATDPALRAALEQAKTNIEKFHRAEFPHTQNIQTMPGISCSLHWRAIERVGLYVPGGTAPLLSTVLMLAIPAQIAGCKKIILCTPPRRDGTLDPAILAAASLCGITEIFTVGGAQAIAAMAYGTQTIPKTDKIFGPGNAYVTAAKQYVACDPDGAAIDMPAGPSEVMVIADETAHADWVAADLLAQAEHGPDSQALLVTTNAAFGEKVARAVVTQLPLLSRQETARKSIASSRIIVAPNMKSAIEIANLYAPEHLIIHNADAAAYLPDIHNAGSVFLGEWSPESVGDYASGTNHVLPTYGYARAYGGLNTLSFMRSMSVQHLTHKALQKLAPTVVSMALAEGLDAHARAVTLRLEEGTA